MKNKKIATVKGFLVVFLAIYFFAGVFTTNAENTEIAVNWAYDPETGVKNDQPAIDTRLHDYPTTAPTPVPAPTPTTPTTTTTTTVSSSVSFTNPLNFSTVEGFLGGIMSAIQKIIVVLALVSIMIGSVMILASAGNSGMVEHGKEAITMALVGLAIGIAAPSILKELANIIGWGGATPAALTLSEIAVRVLNFLLGTMGILALIMLVVGAIMYLTSAGDEDRIDKGKEIFKYSLIGVLMAMASMVLVKQIALFFV